MADLQPGHLLDHLDQAFRSAEGVGRVELVAVGRRIQLGVVFAGRAVPAATDRSLDVQVARERHRDHAAAVGGDVDEDDGVGTGALGVVDGSGADLTARAGAGVGADDQIRLVAGLTDRIDDVFRVDVERGDLGETGLRGSDVPPHRPVPDEREDGDERNHGSRREPETLLLALFALREPAERGVAHRAGPSGSMRLRVGRAVVLLLDGRRSALGGHRIDLDGRLFVRERRLLSRGRRLLRSGGPSRHDGRCRSRLGRWTWLCGRCGARVRGRYRAGVRRRHRARGRHRRRGSRYRRRRSRYRGRSRRGAGHPIRRLSARRDGILRRPGTGRSRRHPGSTGPDRRYDRGRRSRRGRRHRRGGRSRRSRGRCPARELRATGIVLGRDVPSGFRVVRTGGR